MDQRGYPVDPSEQTSPSGLPEVRLMAWSALAARFGAIELVPAQITSAAA